MHILITFPFLAIFNLFIMLLWPTYSYYRAPAAAPAPRDVFGIIMIILTVIAVLADIFYLVLAVAGH